MNCYVHDKAKDVRDDVNEKVCVHHSVYPLKKFDDNNHYCLLHYPSDKKDVVRFERIFNSRLALIGKTVCKCDFRFVWFPSSVNLHNHCFNTPVFFNYATFARGVELGIAKFQDQAQFKNIIFKGTAIFADAIFKKGGYFFETVFSSDAYFGKSKHIKEINFSNAKFLGKAYFRESKFFQKANFEEAIFNGNTYFTIAKFTEKSDACFKHTNFNADTFFEDTYFFGKISFNSAVFSKDSDVFFRRTQFNSEPNFSYVTVENYLTFDEIILSNDSNLNLQNTSFDRAARILFKSSKLRPNYFINADSRKFVFHRIDWKLEKNINEYICDELDEIVNKRGIKKQPLHLLKVVLRHLAENAENNNRFEESSSFRQMAFECERLERKGKVCKWWDTDPREEKGFIHHVSRYPYNILHWAYRWTSGYGESPIWAIWILSLFVLFIFPLGFMIFEFQSCKKTKPLLLSLQEDKEVAICRFNKDEKSDCNCRLGGLKVEEAIGYSLSNATLQTVEYRTPTGFYGSLWATFEKIFAPLQTTLLALAIRRKFMR